MYLCKSGLLIKLYKSVKQKKQRRFKFYGENRKEEKI